MTAESYGLVLALPAALAGVRRGPLAGAVAGLTGGALLAALRLREGPSVPLEELAASAAVLTLTGGWVGRVARSQSGRRLAGARAVWTQLRADQLGEFLSWVLYQLREYMISASALADQLALSAPKSDPAFTDRLERLRRILAELSGKAARMLGEKSLLTTQQGKPVALALGDFVRETAAEARAAFGSSARVSIVEEGGAVSVTCDRRSLRLGLLAVLQNSLQACERRGGGSVSVVVRRRDKIAEIEVVDDGGGLAEEAAGLFEPFYAVRPGSAGLGLGLPMARRSLERLGGTVRLKSAGGGTAALVELPLERGLPFIRNEESTWAGRRSGA